MELQNEEKWKGVFLQFWNKKEELDALFGQIL
jgi:hypothetical protein